jgi:hypothetical protein
MSEDNPFYGKSGEDLKKAIKDDMDRHYRIALSPEVLSKGKKKQTPSNELTDFVISKVKEMGGTARRVNTQGQYDQATGRYRTSGMRRGFEDVDACIPVMAMSKSGRFKVGIKVGIEIKIGKDKLNEYQVKRMNELKAAGGYYLVATGKEQITAALDMLRNTITDMLL